MKICPPPWSIGFGLVEFEARTPPSERFRRGQGGRNVGRVLGQRVVSKIKWQQATEIKLHPEEREIPAVTGD